MSVNSAIGLQTSDACLLISFPHFAFEHLAGDISWERLHDDHIPDALEFGIHPAVGPFD
jgi:hypothetical protein